MQTRKQAKQNTVSLFNVDKYIEQGEQSRSAKSSTSKPEDVSGIVKFDFVLPVAGNNRNVSSRGLVEVDKSAKAGYDDAIHSRPRNNPLGIPAYERRYKMGLHRQIERAAPSIIGEILILPEFTGPARKRRRSTHCNGR